MRLPDGHPGTFNPTRLKVARQRRGLDTAEVARALGIQVPRYRRWERGDATPSWQEVGQLSFALRFPASFFYGETLPEPQSVHICGSGGCHRC